MKTDSEREELFARMLDGNQRRLMSIARSFAGGDEAQDLYQEILTRLWQSLPGFEQRCSIGTWVHRVALNVAINFSRNRARRTKAFVELRRTGRLDASCAAQERGPAQILQEYLRSLGRTDRAVFLMYLNNLSYREMAEVMGMEESHLRVRISRLKSRFEERYIGK